MRYAYTSASGERRLVPTSTRLGGPDERGVYRIWGLAPGEYYVSRERGRPLHAAGRDLHLTSDVDVQQAARAIQEGPAVAAAMCPQRTSRLRRRLLPGDRGRRAGDA